MIVTFICTGRGTHDPQVVCVYDGDIPVPEYWIAYPRRSEMDLLCDRAKGGCGRAPRPGNARSGRWSMLWPTCASGHSI